MSSCSRTRRTTARARSSRSSRTCRSAGSWWSGTTAPRGKKHGSLGSTAAHVCINTDACVLVTHDTDNLPAKNASARFVVAVENNAASTKAFMDAMALSRKGDTVDVVHLVAAGTQARVHAEMLRMKYTYLFSSTTIAAYLEGRNLQFTMLPRDGPVPETIASYADEVKANFLCVGTVKLAKARHGSAGWEKWHGPTSVGEQLCSLASCTVCLSHFTDKDRIVARQPERVSLPSHALGDLKRRQVVTF